VTSEDRIAELFAQANPVPNPNALLEHPDPHLAALEHRSEDFDAGTLRDESSTQRPLRSGALLSAVAAVLVLVGGLAAWLLTGRLGSIPQDTLVDPRVATVLSAIDAYNAGDVEGWVAAFDPGAQEVQAEEVGPRWFEIMMSANARIDVVEPCHLSEADPTLVECTLRYTDDYFTPAGFLGTAPAEFHVDDHLRITDWEDNQICCAAYDQRIFGYNDAFYTWLQAAYPAVYEQIKPADNPRDVPGYKTDPASMAIAIQYVDEFIAQSDAYPVATVSP
jgi:hypothetical protein